MQWISLAGRFFTLTNGCGSFCPPMIQATYPVIKFAALKTYESQALPWRLAQ